jgi:hypothetical protein
MNGGRPLPPRIRRLRLVLGTLGVLVMVYALLGALMDRDVSRVGHVVFLVAVLVAHDGLLLPLALGLGALVVRFVARPARAVVQAALFATVVLLVVGVPLALGFGRPADNPSALPRNYPLGLVGCLALVWLLTGGWLAIQTVRRRSRGG